MNPTDFIARWSGVAASELSTSQSFLRHLFDAIWCITASFGKVSQQGGMS